MLQKVPKMTENRGFQQKIAICRKSAKTYARERLRLSLRSAVLQACAHRPCCPVFGAAARLQCKHLHAIIACRCALVHLCGCTDLSGSKACPATGAQHPHVTAVARTRTVCAICGFRGARFRENASARACVCLCSKACAHVELCGERAAVSRSSRESRF